MESEESSRENLQTNKVNKEKMNFGEEYRSKVVLHLWKNNLSCPIIVLF